MGVPLVTRIRIIRLSRATGFCCISSACSPRPTSPLLRIALAVPLRCLDAVPWETGSCVHAKDPQQGLPAIQKHLPIATAACPPAMVSILHPFSSRPRYPAV